MLLFDAPFRESCTLRRSRTNTPLQALNLLNDPTYVEAARFLAARMVQTNSNSIDSRLDAGFQLLLARHPKPRELAVLREAYQRLLVDFEKDPEGVKNFLSVGENQTENIMQAHELAALTFVACILLNLDEVITN